MDIIYLDNNATTRVADEVLEVMLPFFRVQYGNSSSMHSFGGNCQKFIKKSREQTAELLGCEDPEEIIYTSCGTESDNTAIYSALETFPEKKHIITTKVEHPAVLNVCRHYAAKGYQLTEIPVDSEGMINIDLLKESITDQTAVVSVMMANNETGVIFPIEEIGQIVKSKGAIYHVDAVQAIGKIPINLKNSTIDMLTLSGHKIHAQKGIGVLYVRKGNKFSPFMIGGHQEKNRRAGTENVPSIIGLGKACEIAGKYLLEESKNVKILRDKLENSLLQKISHSKLNGHKEHRLPNTTNLSFEFIEGEAILLLLDREGICASSGSACTSGSLEPSHVLRAMGVPFTYVHGSVRFSLSRYTTESEIDKTIDVMPKIIERLRSISPYWKERNSRQ